MLEGRPGVTGGEKELQGVTRGYRGFKTLHGVTRLQRVTSGYR